MHLDRRTLLKGAAAGAAANYKIAITEQATGKILVLDRNGSWSGSGSWSFDCGTARGWKRMQEVRFRDTARYGMIALLAGGEDGDGHAAIVNVSPGKPHTTRADVLWSAAIPSYPHCIERIPNKGMVVVAGSRGKLHPFVQTGSDPARSLKALTPLTVSPTVLPHGLLWDPRSSLLWMIGGTELRSYRVTGSGASARLAEHGSRIKLKTTAGTHHGHDLQPDFTDPTRLLISDTNGVYAVDKVKRAITGRVLNLTGVKSFVIGPTGEWMWTRDADLSDGVWGGPSVGFKTSAAAAPTYRTRSRAQIYKARLWTTDYL